MKRRILVASLLSLVGMALSAAPASAFWWHRHGINRYSTVIVCRPYNAFTPVCSGSMVCDGCCPFACPNVPSGACCSPGMHNPMLSMCHDPLSINSGYSGSYAGMPMAMNMQMPMQMPMPMGMPMMQPPMPMGPAGPAAPNWTPPVPMPTPVNTQTYQPMPQGYQLQPANYQAYYPMPMYYPAYAPVGYQQPQQMPAPSYWYGY